jgi:DNA primase
VGDFAPVDVERLLAALGIEAERRGTKLVSRCPHPEHNDRNPSWMIRDDPGERWHGSHSCRSCGLGGGPWELVAAVRGITIDEAARFVQALGMGRRVLPREVPDVKVTVRRRMRYRLPIGVELPEALEQWSRPALQYLMARGVTHEQIQRWGLGYATTGPLAWRVVIPVVTRQHLLAYVARSIFDDGSKRYDMPGRQDGARPDLALWGEARFDPARGAVTVAEGVFSALALERAGAPNPCALLGSQLTPHKVSLLEKWPVVLVATDPDAAGENVARVLARSLARHCYVERVQLEDSPDDCDAAALRRVVDEATGGFANVVARPPAA